MSALIDWTNYQLNWSALPPALTATLVLLLAVAVLIRERASAGDRMMCVLTLGPSVPEDPGDNYAGTRAFYVAQRFVPLRELGLRDWNDSHALMLARAL